MNQIVCPHPLIPIRSEPDHRSEQISQQLFGETALILEKKGDWLKIKTDFDAYTGWTEEKSIQFIPDDETLPDTQCVLTPLCILRTGNATVYVPAGSEIPTLHFNNKFVMGNKEYSLQNELLAPKASDRKNLIITSIQFLNSPYLWGGRTVFGFDCSGFVQVVFKINGVKLMRDAKDQANQGEGIDNLENAIPGDLLFFISKEEKVSHTGIFLGNGKIIHASVSVRIDTIDRKGIYNTETKTYTHELHCIRRCF